jgi:hypothetical protein
VIDPIRERPRMGKAGRSGGREKETRPGEGSKCFNIEIDVDVLRWSWIGVEARKKRGSGAAKDSADTGGEREGWREARGR